MVGVDARALTREDRMVRLTVDHPFHDDTRRRERDLAPRMCVAQGETPDIHAVGAC